MEYLSYIPSLFSIFLIAISYFPQNFLRERIRTFCQIKKELADHNPVITNIALSWEATITYFNTMFLAFITVFVIWDNQSNPVYPIIAFILLLSSYIPTFFWVITHDIDGLASSVTKNGIKHVTVLSVILVAIHLGLIVLIALNESFGPGP